MQNKRISMANKSKEDEKWINKMLMISKGMMMSDILLLPAT